MTLHARATQAPGRQSGLPPLVVRAVSQWAGERGGASFLARRLLREAHARAAGRERAVVTRVACLLEEPGSAPAHLVRELVSYAGFLEEQGRLDEAAPVLRQADALASGCPEIALHAARIARKSGDSERARALYGEVRSRCCGRGTLDRMASIGEAMIADDPRADLGRVLRRAILAGEREAAAVAQEQRARARRAGGDRDGALRDYLVAAARFPAEVDRGRVLHEAADMASARGDLLAARELLLVALREGRPEQRAHAASRLHALSRALGDELGRRRWLGSGPTGLVSLTPGGPAGGVPSAASRVARMLRRSGLAGRGLVRP